MTITIQPIAILKDNYVWTLIDTSSKRALVVDPGEAAPVSAYIRENKLTLAGILITHHHWDHTNGVMELINTCNPPVFGSALEKTAGVTNMVHDHESISITNFPLTLQVIAIPGHTLGHIAYYAKGMLFCGDTLFSAGCGRIFEGTAAQMYATLQKITALPDDTNIYCGHEYTLNNLRFAATVEPENQKIAERIQIVHALRDKNLPSLPSTLLEEKHTNVFLRCDSPEVIANVEKHAGNKLDNPIAVFTELRKWKDDF